MPRRHLIARLRRFDEPPIALPVRAVTPDDAEALAVLMLDAYAGTIDSDGLETLDDARTEVAGFFAGAPLLEHSLVAEADGRPAAAVLVSRHDDVPLIAYVMTAANHKGKGLASSLVARALRSLHAAGERRAHLWVTAGNVPAERIYRRLGFRRASALPSRPSAGMTGMSIGGFLAGIEHLITGRPRTPAQIEEQYREPWNSAEGVTVDGLDEPIERPEPPDRSGAKL